MSYIPTYAQAHEMLEKYNQEPFHLQHGETVSAVMRYFAKEYDPENEEFWAVVGLLHDLDFEKWPEEHCVKCQEIMRDADIDEKLIHAVACHGYGMTPADIKPELYMEKVLFAVDELTGLIGAVVRMRPSKSTLDLELPSVKKKFKDKSFAAGCSRDTIRKGAEMLNMDLDELITKTIMGMRTMEQAD